MQMSLLHCLPLPLLPSLPWERWVLDACWGKAPIWVSPWWHLEQPRAEQGSAQLPKDGSHQRGSLLSVWHKPSCQCLGSRATGTIRSLLPLCPGLA